MRRYVVTRLESGYLFEEHSVSGRNGQSEWAVVWRGAYGDIISAAKEMTHRDRAPGPVDVDAARQLGVVVDKPEAAE